MLTGISQRQLKQRILATLSEADREAYRVAAAANATLFTVLLMLAVIVMSVADLDPQLAYQLAITSKLAPTQASVAENTQRK